MCNHQFEEHHHPFNVDDIKKYVSNIFLTSTIHVSRMKIIKLVKQVTLGLC